MTTDPHYSDILRTITAWPPELRLVLAHDILGTVRRDMGGAGGKRNTLDRALGLARGGGSAPTDEQVQQWIGEHRAERYGS